MVNAKPGLIRNLIFSGLVAERFAVGLTAALRPSSLLVDGSYGRLFTRGFGVRHLALGAGLLLFRNNKKSLVQFAVLNAAVETADAFAILGESSRGRPPRTLAIGSFVGALGCVALAVASATSLETDSSES